MLDYISIGLPLVLALVAIRLFRRNLNSRNGTVLLVSYFISILAVVPAIVIKSTAAEFGINHKVTTLFGKIGYSMFTAFVDEFNKYIVVISYAYRKKEFDEPLAGIIICIMIGLGFITGDNLIHHFVQGDIYSSTWRMPTGVVLSIPFAVSMGFYSGMSKYGMDTDDVNSLIYRWRGLIIATIWHGTYNFFLFMEDYNDLTVLIVFVVFFLVIHLVNIVFKALKLHTRLITSRRKRTVLDD